MQAVGDTSTEAKPIWQLYNNQGPAWSYAQANVNEKTDFNIVFEGTWGPNRASGTIGIDDIAFYTGNCSGEYRNPVCLPIFRPSGTSGSCFLSILTRNVIIRCTTERFLRVRTLRFLQG